MTLERVAEEVGVPALTVVSAYHRPDQLPPALRERILDAARRLGYAGPPARAGAIGVLADTGLAFAFADPAAAAVLAGVAQAAEEDGLGVLLVPPSGAALLSSDVLDGLVVHGVAQGDPLLALAVDRRLPAVVVDQPRGTGLPVVGIDEEAAAAAATEHLVALGHRRLAVVTGPLGPDGRTGPADLMRRWTAVYPVARARLAGCAAVLGAAGVDWPGVPVHECAGRVRAAGRAAAERLLAAPGRPTAVLALDDQLALGVLDAAAAAGLAVPGDLAVAGFGDVPEAATAGLTTVAQDHRAKGRAAAAVLLAGLRGDRPAPPPRLAHALVARASTTAV